MEVVLQPRSGVGELLGDYHAGKLTYTELCRAVAALGYSTDSLYWMVMSTKPKPQMLVK